MHAGWVGSGYVSLCELPRFHLALEVGGGRHTVASVSAILNFPIGFDIFLDFFHLSNYLLCRQE